MPNTVAKSVKPVSFRAKLEAADNGLHWVIARIPIDLKKAWPEWKSRRVHGTLNGFAFSNALLPGANGKGHTLLVYKKLQHGAHARVGDTVQVTLEPDLSERPEYPMPQELASVFKGERILRKWFDALPPSYIKSICRWVDEAKSAETRVRRAEQMAERLMLTMEGERELPPILRVAFERQPLAHEGWTAMTKIQRRNHLFGIYYYQTASGRQKRVSQVVEEAVIVARRKRGEKVQSKDRYTGESSDAFDDFERFD